MTESLKRFTKRRSKYNLGGGGRTMKSNRRNPARYLSVLLCLLSLIYSPPILSLPAKSAEAEQTAYAKPTDEINMNTLYGENPSLRIFPKSAGPVRIM